MKGFVIATTLALLVSGFTIYTYYNKGEETNSYAQNLQKIAEKVNSMNTTWKAELPERFINQSKEQVQRSMMPIEFVSKSLRATPDLVKKVFTDEEIAATPDSFDSRTAWPKCESIAEVRDQSACGSCWAFGAAETMSDRICIASGQTNQTRVSAEDILECDSGFFKPNNGCNGGLPSAAFNFWKNTGVVSGGLYGDTKYCKNYKFAPCGHHVHSSKYPDCPSGEYSTPSCKKSCTNSDDYNSSKTYASEVYGVSGESDLKTELSQNGSVEVAFTVYEDFPTYKSGVYKHVTGGQLGGHAVKMIGYGTEDGTDYWLVANSWNETWGDNGFFKIKRGNDECGIESQGVTGKPKL